MKRYITYFIIAIATVLMATSCEKDVMNFHSSKEGGLSLDLKINNTELVTRALTNEQIAALTPKVNIYKPNFEGLIRSYSYSQMPSPIYLPVGEGYRVDVLAGEVSKASPRKANFDTKSYKGSANFNIVAGQTTNAVAVEAKIINAITKVSFAESIAANFAEGYTLTVALSEEDLASNDSANRKLVYNASNVASDTKSGEGYFIIDDIKEETSVYWNFQGTLTKDGSTFSASGNFTATTDSDNDNVNDLVAARQNMSFRYDVKDGTLKFGISSDTTIPETEDNIIWEPKSTGISTPKPYDIWATHLNISADVDAEQYSGAKFQYRVKNTTTPNAWSSSVTATQNTDGTYSATISGLTPNTTYEFRLICTPATEGATTPADVVVGATDSNTDGDLKEIKTAPATQIPNASFEQTSNASGVWEFYDSNNDFWWDSGNQTSPIKVEVTTSEEYEGSDALKNENNLRYVKMQSAWKVITFAAGNLYCGQYGSTDMESQTGTVYFGRPWDNYSRPTALRLYVRYNSNTINQNANKIPEKYNKNSNSYDQAQIKIAIGTWERKDYANGYDATKSKYSPIVADTKYPDKIIDYESDGIDKKGTIAYGNAIIDGEAKTEGNDVYINGVKSSKNYSNWGVITIPLVYYRTNELPKYIVISCAASRFGDYMAGSDSSCLDIDCLELIYDSNITNYQPANN